MLAGVSASYYTRLEQGQVDGASPQVIDALARALHLSAVESDHLHALARPPANPSRSSDPPVETVAEDFVQVLDGVGGTPALVFGRRRDILAWNPAGHALFAGHLDPAAVQDVAARPNATALVFLDGHTRELYVDWHEKAQASVGHLRILAAQYPGDRRLLALIGGLTVQSAEFAALWAANRVRPSNSSVYRMQHPLVGRLTVTQQLLSSASAPGQTLVLCTAARDSASAQALRLLAHSIGGTETPPRNGDRSESAQ